MTEKKPTKFIIETTDTKEMECFLNAPEMFAAIRSCYRQVLREFYKHRELTEDQQQIRDEINEKLTSHFQYWSDDE